MSSLRNISKDSNDSLESEGCKSLYPETDDIEELRKRCVDINEEKKHLHIQLEYNQTKVRRLQEKVLRRDKEIKDCKKELENFEINKVLLEYHFMNLQENYTSIQQELNAKIYSYRELDDKYNIKEKQLKQSNENYIQLQRHSENLSEFSDNEVIINDLKRDLEIKKIAINNMKEKIKYFVVLCKTENINNLKSDLQHCQSEVKKRDSKIFELERLNRKLIGMNSLTTINSQLTMNNEEDRNSKLPSWWKYHIKK